MSDIMDSILVMFELNPALDFPALVLWQQWLVKQATDDWSPFASLLLNV